MHFRVWAPRRKKVEVVFVDCPAGGAAVSPLVLAPQKGGYFAGHSAPAAAGSRYAFQLDDESKRFPDPASRSQPDGPHGPSEIVDPGAFSWHDSDWPGVVLKGQVLYELHVGTFSRNGTWNSAVEHLPHLVDLGVTLIEVMPIAEFAGRFGWGYDGVNLFAPTRLYGTPHDFRRFVDAAHGRGLGVVLDVVYNHFGPVGNYLGQFSKDYVSSRHQTPWGDGINFDGENSAPVRELMIANAGYWIDEFHVDGLRLDALHSILDDSPDHIVAALARRVREAAGKRKTLVFAENEFQQARFLRPADRGGWGLDAAWNDDFHHSARVALTGHNEHYYGDYQGTPQELISAVKWGHLYQGQWNTRQSRRRGSPALDLDAAQFVNFLENHDQVANTPLGKRPHQLTSPGRHRALTALMALSPGTPMLFQGQEFSSSTPFLYFADHEPELGASVRQGRREGLRHFHRLAGHDMADSFDDPCDIRTFERSKLDFAERESHAAAYALHRDLFRLRREDRIFSAQRADRIQGAVISAEAFLLRFFGDEGDDRLLLVNLGRDIDWRPAAEPLLAAPEGTAWRLLWSSEDPRYGGLGTRPLEAQSWYVSGHAAVALQSRPEQIES